MAFIVGTPGNDFLLTGTADSDTIFGSGGNDYPFSVTFRVKQVVNKLNYPEE